MKAVIIFSVIFYFTLIPLRALSTSFSDKPNIEIVVEKPEFLKSVGLNAFSEELVGSKDKEEFVVVFEPFVIKGREKIIIELLLVNSKNELIIAIENPFPNVENRSRYIISRDHSLMVSVVKNLKKDTTYHKVIFSSP